MEQLNEDEMMELIAEQLEGKIPPRQFMRLDRLLVENPKARISYLDMIALRAGLEKIFRKKSKMSISRPS